jgi:hypothetical protein
MATVLELTPLVDFVTDDGDWAMPVPRAATTMRTPTTRIEFMDRM